LVSRIEAGSLDPRASAWAALARALATTVDRLNDEAAGIESETIRAIELLVGGERPAWPEVAGDAGRPAVAGLVDFVARVRFRKLRRRLVKPGRKSKRNAGL
jgi:hypothetical protein